MLKGNNFFGQYTVSGTIFLIDFDHMNEYFFEKMLLGTAFYKNVNSGISGSEWVILEKVPNTYLFSNLKSNESIIVHSKPYFLVTVAPRKSPRYTAV